MTYVHCEVCLHEVGRTRRFSAVASPGHDASGDDGIRWGIVNHVRAELAAGTCLTDEKLEIALTALRQALTEAV